MPQENPRFFEVSTIGDPTSENVKKLRSIFPTLSATQVPDYYEGPATSSSRTFSGICGEKQMREIVEEMDSKDQIVNFGILEHYSCHFSDLFLDDTQPFAFDTHYKKTIESLLKK